MVVSYKGDGNTEGQEKKKTQSIHHCYYAVFLTKNRKYKKKPTQCGLWVTFTNVIQEL